MIEEEKLDEFGFEVIKSPWYDNKTICIEQVISEIKQRDSELEVVGRISNEIWKLKTG